MEYLINDLVKVKLDNIIETLDNLGKKINLYDLKNVLEDDGCIYSSKNYTSKISKYFENRMMKCNKNEINATFISK